MCGVNCICSNVGVVGCDVVMDGCVVLDDCEVDVFKCGARPYRISRLK